MAGACVIGVGCGGSDVPDTSTEGQAIAGGGAPPNDNAAAAPEANPEVASAPPAANKEEAAAPAAEPSTPAAPPATAQAPAKKEGGSATAEMLALAANPPSGSNPAGAGGAAPNAPSGNSQPQPGAPGPGGPMGGMPAGMAAMMRGGGARPGMGPGGPGAPGAPGASSPGGMPPGMMPGMQGGGPNPGDMAKMMAGRMGANMNMGNRPGAAGAAGDNVMSPGGGGGPGGGGLNGPADNKSPENAVRAFLKALKAKDRDALNEATAGHAYLEAREKNRDTFKKIFDLELSDSELDELSKQLDGYQILTWNPPKSTGRLDVVIQKPGVRGAFFRRRVTVRKEKKGWGVMDISGAEEFKSMMNYGQRRR